MVEPSFADDMEDEIMNPHQRNPMQPRPAGRPGSCPTCAMLRERLGATVRQLQEVTNSYDILKQRYARLQGQYESAVHENQELTEQAEGWAQEMEELNEALGPDEEYEYEQEWDDDE